MGPWLQRVLLWLQRCPVPLDVAFPDLELAVLMPVLDCLSLQYKTVLQDLLIHWKNIWKRE